MIQLGDREVLDQDAARVPTTGSPANIASAACRPGPPWLP